MKKTSLIISIVVALAVATFIGLLERYSPRYDAQYIGAAECGNCHTQIYPEWQHSPHANMVRDPGPASVVGDFSDATWMLPETERQSSPDPDPAARMYSDDGKYYMALRMPGGQAFQPFEIEYVVGYQYRQVYLTREAGGVLRRLPL